MGPRRRGGSPEAGLSLIELLVALAILALVITLSLAVFFDRQKRLITAAENIQAYQAVANEAEYQRHRSYAAFKPDAPEPFATLIKHMPDDVTIVDTLPNVTSVVLAHDAAPGVRSVTMTLNWGQPSAPHRAAMTLLRTPTRLW